MADLVTYLLCGVRPKTQTTLTIKADKINDKFALLTWARTNGPDDTATHAPQGNEWTLTLDERDWVLQVTGPDDEMWEGLTVTLSSAATLVTRPEKQDKIGETSAAATTDDPKDPWPPPGAPAQVDTTWLAPKLDLVFQTALLPKDL